MTTRIVRTVVSFTHLYAHFDMDSGTKMGQVPAKGPIGGFYYVYSNIVLNSRVLLQNHQRVSPLVTWAGHQSMKGETGATEAQLYRCSC